MIKSGTRLDKSGLHYLFCQVSVLNTADCQYVFSTFSINDHYDDLYIVSLRALQTNYN